MKRTQTLPWLRVAAVLFALMILPVALTRYVSTESKGLDLVINDACAQDGQCCFQFGAVCYPFPNSPLNHKYLTSGQCP